MDANMLINKIVENGLGVSEAMAICEKLYDPNGVTVKDAIWIKKRLGLSDLEAIEIFLS